MTATRRRSSGNLWAGIAMAGTLLGSCLAGVTACKTSCSVDEDKTAEVVEDGITDLEDGTYESSTWDDEYREFPPKKRYEFRHGLGGRPKNVQTWVGFDEKPLGDRPYGDVAESAGNIVIIEAVTSEYIRVRNDTCETFYLRLFASNPERSNPVADGADVGTGGGP